MADARVSPQLSDQLQICVESNQLLQEAVVWTNVSSPTKESQGRGGVHLPVDHQVGEDTGGAPGHSHLAANHHLPLGLESPVDEVRGHPEVGQDGADGRIPDCEAEVVNPRAEEIVGSEVDEACICKQVRD